MKYKQYYWAPVTLPGAGSSSGAGSGRGRRGAGGSAGRKKEKVEAGGRVWEVDWEE